jgi:hypothetical protein
MEKLNPVQALKAFFEADGGRPLTLEELKKLTSEERRELAELAAKAMGIELAEKSAA